MAAAYSENQSTAGVITFGFKVYTEMQSYLPFQHHVSTRYHGDAFPHLEIFLESENTKPTHFCSFFLKNDEL